MFRTKDQNDHFLLYIYYYFNQVKYIKDPNEHIYYILKTIVMGHFVYFLLDSIF